MQLTILSPLQGSSIDLVVFQGSHFAALRASPLATLCHASGAHSPIRQFTWLFITALGDQNILKIALPALQPQPVGLPHVSIFC